MPNIASYAYCYSFIVAYNLLYFMLLPYYNNKTTTKNSAIEFVALKKKIHR